MTRFHDDPEVLADLRLRDASEHDEERSSLVRCEECRCRVRDHDEGTGPCRRCGCTEFVRPGGVAWAPEAIVARRPCSKGCGALVELPQAALDQMARWNAMLARRREPPITSIPCEACKRIDDELAALQQRGSRAPASAITPAAQRLAEQTRITGFDDDNERPSGMRGRKGRP